MTENIVIVGAGQAGSQAVDTLRREGYQGRLTLIGEEASLPYQRPPLSKKYLAGELEQERLLLRHQAFYEDHRTELLLGVQVQRLDRKSRTIHLADGRAVLYDRLLLCLGATPRQLSCPGATLAGIHLLRGIGHSDAIRAGIRRGAAVVIVGGGYIGLEVAATCRTLGCSVVVLEMADRVMNRVVAPDVSEFFLRQHRAHGVTIACNQKLVRFEGAGAVQRAVCADGSAYLADMVVVGVGAAPATDLAAAAGLTCDNGIVVDEYCRTDDPLIYAAGDCTNHPSPHFGGRQRLESVDNAFEQAKSAALNMLDRAATYDRVPWFWSDQFDTKLLIVGLPKGHDRTVLRGDPASGSFSVCYLRNNELLALEAINHSKDYMAARKLIQDRVPLDLARLADASVALKETSIH
jgi:3-phenylpropionate/trans-cinnamate dioxygenase ferredoxin reductase component